MSNRRPKALYAATLLVALIGMPGCGYLGDVKRSIHSAVFGATAIVTPTNIRIVTDHETNFGYPITVDLAITNDTIVYSQLSKLRAAEWFVGKSDYLRQYPEALHVRSWEVVPGTVVQRDVPKHLNDVVGGLIFVDYVGVETHRLNVSGSRAVSLELRKDHFTHAPFVR